MTSFNLVNFFFFNLLLKFVFLKKKLIFVYEHARHGARGPSSSYGAILKNGVDEYQINWGTDGELSQIGKRQHYLLGVRNRIKYDGFINFTHYNPKEILIHATNYNRTHQSILSELYGMYENIVEDELKNEERDYSLVNFKYMNQSLQERINSSNEKNDLGYKVNGKSFPVFNVHPFPSGRIFLVDHCIKLKNYRDEKVGKDVEEFYKEFDANFSAAFTNFTNHSVDFFHLYDIMKSITDHFICDYDNKKNLSHLADKGLNLTAFYDFSKRFYGHFIFNYFIDEYTSGLEETHLLQDVLSYMDSRIENINNTTYLAPKMVMDCGHDTTVGPIARFMNASFHVPYHTFCEFACNIYFELYERDGKDNYTVDYYLDDELIFEGMDYKLFKKTLQDNFWNDTYMDQFCGREEDTNINSKNKLSDYANLLFAVSMVTTILLIIFVTSTIVIFRRLKILQRKYRANSLMTKETKGSELSTLL